MISEFNCAAFCAKSNIQPPVVLWMHGANCLISNAAFGQLLDLDASSLQLSLNAILLNWMPTTNIDASGIPTPPNPLSAHQR